MLHLKKDKKDFPYFFIIDNVKVSNETQIANHFNTFFTSIGPKLASNINTLDKPSFNTYLRGNVNSVFKFENINDDEVLNLIRKYKAKTSTDKDDLSMKLIKYIDIYISKPLSVIINQSLNTGIFPSLLKIAKVIPIYKCEDEHILNNYRPISLLPILSKIFEKVVFKQVYSYFQNNNLLYISLHGFRKEHSTETATLELTDTIIQKLDNNETPFALFLDLSKAFDTLDHSILLAKLRYYGFSNMSLLWFSSYLSDRQQYVQINYSKSNLLTITTGVLQGSILGPLLFIIYMNDVSEVSNSFNTILYADDTSLVGSVNTFSVPNGMYINNEIEKIHNWLCVNKLSLNIKKTKFMLFRHPQSRLENIPTIMLNGVAIERVAEFKFLGTVIDETLSWKSHLNFIRKKISRNIGIIKRSKRYLPEKVLLQMYYSLILPNLTYSISVWGFQSESIFKLQKKGRSALLQINKKCTHRSYF